MLESTPSGEASGGSGGGERAPSAGESGLAARDDAAAQLFFATIADTTDAAEGRRRRANLFNRTIARLAAMTPNTPEYLENARNALNAGYFLSWSLLDNRELRAALTIIADMDSILGRYSEENMPPELVFAAARMIWLKERLADDFPDQQRPSEGAERILRLTRDPDVFRGDYVPLMSLRYLVHWRARRSNYRESRLEACRIAAAIDRIVLDVANVVRMVDCRLQAAEYSRMDGRYQAAQADLADARRRAAEMSRQMDGDADVTIWGEPQIGLAMVNIELVASELAGAMGNPIERARRRLAAIEAFGRALTGNAYLQHTTTQIRDYYEALVQTDLSELPEYSSDQLRRAANIRLLGSMANAVEASLSAFPQSPSYVYVGGHANDRLASLNRNAGNMDMAAAASARAAALFRAGGLTQRAEAFTEDAELECGAYSRRVSVLVEMRRADDALAAYRDIEQACGAWLRRFPWDFYVRQHRLQAAGLLGRLLHQEHRYRDAVPILGIASDWGDRASSLYLVDIYRHGRGGVGIDRDRADALKELATRQRIMRASIPTTIGGDRQSFNVTMLEYARGAYCPVRPDSDSPTAACIGFEGVDDQVEWVARARAGEVPANVVDTLRRLNRLARENNVSFPELIAYALDRTEQPEAGASNPGAAGSGAGEERAAPRAPPAAGSPEAAPAKPVHRGDPDAPFPIRLAQFFSDFGPPENVVTTETFVIPYFVQGSCFRWALTVPPEQRDVTLREVFELPAPTPNWGGITERTVVADNGRHVTTRLDENLDDGTLGHAWCITDGDPVGPHRIRVYQGDNLLHQFDFEVMREESSRPGA